MRAYQALYEQHKEATRSWLHMHYRLLLLLSSLATVLGIVALAIFPNGDIGRVGSDGEDIFDSGKVGPLPLTTAMADPGPGPGPDPDPSPVPDPIPDPKPDPEPGPEPEPEPDPEQVGSFRWSWNLGTTVLALGITAISSALLRYTPQADRTLEECDAAIAQCDKLVAMCAET